MATQINKRTLQPNSNKNTGESLLKLGLIFGLGIAAVNPAPILASESNNHQQQATLVAQATSTRSPLPNGNYLYGQSSKPDTIGQEYLVFKVEQGKVVGAIYLPRSEFSCFSGSLNQEQMNVSIVDPYTNNTYPYSIAVETTPSVATVGRDLPYSVGLMGYQQIDDLSDNDRRMLNTCSNSF